MFQCTVGCVVICLIRPLFPYLAQHLPIAPVYDTSRTKALVVQWFYQRSLDSFD